MNTTREHHDLAGLTWTIANPMPDTKNGGLSTQASTLISSALEAVIDDPMFAARVDFQRNRARLKEALLSKLDAIPSELQDEIKRSVVLVAERIARSVMEFRNQKPLQETAQQELDRIQRHANEHAGYMAVAIQALLQRSADPEMTLAKSHDVPLQASEMVGHLRADIARKIGEVLNVDVVKQSGKDKMFFALAEGKEHQMNHELKAFIEERAERGRQEFRLDPNIRTMTAIYRDVEKYCAKKSIPCPLLDLTLGDISQFNMTPEVAEGLGLPTDGPKASAIAASARAFKSLCAQAGIDLNRYQSPEPLGLDELRAERVAHITKHGLYDSNMPVKESIIGEGESGVLVKAFMAAQMAVREAFPEFKDKEIEVCAPAPCFKMVPDLANRIKGLRSVEMHTKREDKYFPSGEGVREFLELHPDCKIFNLTAIGNPNATIMDPTLLKEVLDVLREKHVLLIADLAYFRTGDNEGNNAIAEILKTYPYRIDAFSASKTDGIPASRFGIATTPSTEIAKFFGGVGKATQLAEPIEMQLDMLFRRLMVDDHAREQLSSLFRRKQDWLISTLKKIDDKREQNGQSRLFETTPDAFIGDAALYVLIHLAKKVDPFELIIQLGLVLTPSQSFYSHMPPATRFARASLGLMDPPEEDKMAA